MPGAEVTHIDNGFVYFAANNETDAQVAVAVVRALGHTRRPQGSCLMVVATTRPDLRPAHANTFSTDADDLSAEKIKGLQTRSLIELLAKLDLVNADGTAKVRETARALAVPPPIVTRIVNVTHKVTLNHLHRIARLWKRKGLGAINAEPSFHTLVTIALA